MQENIIFDLYISVVFVEVVVVVVVVVVIVVTSSCGRCSCVANYFSTWPLFTYE